MPTPNCSRLFSGGSSKMAASTGRAVREADGRMPSGRCAWQCGHATGGEQDSLAHTVQPEMHESRKPGVRSRAGSGRREESACRGS